MPRVVQAQAFDVAPIEVFTHARYDSDNDFGQIVFGTQRSIPVYTLLPQVSPDSYFHMARIVVGGQLDERNDKQRFRYRVTAIETEIQKSPWSGHFKFLDYDKSGLEDLWADWLSIGIGPGIHFGSEETQIVVRALGHAALNSYRFGDRVFGGLGNSAGKTRTGGSYGASGRIALVWVKRFILRGAYDVRWLTAGTGARKDAVEIMLEVHLGKGWGIFGTYSDLEVDLANLSEDRTAFGGGLRYTVGLIPD